MVYDYGSENFYVIDQMHISELGSKWAVFRLEFLPSGGAFHLYKESFIHGVSFGH